MREVNTFASIHLYDTLVFYMYCICKHLLKFLINCMQLLTPSIVVCT